MIDTNEAQPDCQIKQVHHIDDGHQEKVPLARTMRLVLRRILGPRNVRLIKGYVYDLLKGPAKLQGRAIPAPAPAVPGTPLHFKPGDHVRVRSMDEIEATLDRWEQLKGCSFLPEMLEYCNSTQKVLKPVERFVDERDLRIRKTKGIVLLEGVVCQGTSSLGRCDRNCLYFWRGEWLERITEDQ